MQAGTVSEKRVMELIRAERRHDATLHWMIKSVFAKMTEAPTNWHRSRCSTSRLRSRGCAPRKNRE